MSGRGRGRGRGRGGVGRGGPVLKSEDGAILFAKKFDEPPPLFPKVETLPERPEISKAENAALVERRRVLHAFWNESAYYIEPATEKESSSLPEEQYFNRSKPGVQTKRKALSLYLQLSSEFFPSELLGNQRKRRKADQSGMWNLQSSTKSDLGRLDKLASLEQKAGQKGEKDTEEKKGEEEEEEDDKDIEFDDEEEEGDYETYEHFDDDDEYDMDDGGDDEGPTY